MINSRLYKLLLWKVICFRYRRGEYCRRKSNVTYVRLLCPDPGVEGYHEILKFFRHLAVRFNAI
jgi:hypothetical protein